MVNLFLQGYDDDWDSDFDDQPDPSSQMPPPAAPGGAGGGGGMLSVPKNSNQSGSSGDVRYVKVCINQGYYIETNEG